MGAPPPAPARADALAGAVGRAFSWVFVLAILLAAYEVVMRYLFGAPSSWALPTTTMLCQIGFALGGAWCMARGEHIRISFVPDQLGRRARWAVDLVALLTGAFYLAGLLYAVGLDAQTSLWRFDFQGAWDPERTPGPPNWPLPSIGKAALVAGTALFLAVVAARLARHLRGAGAAPPPRPAPGTRPAEA